MALFEFDSERKRLMLLFCAILIVASIPGVPVQVAAAPPSVRPDAPVELADVQTLDQDGRSLNFASEAIGDRIVVVNFIYTSCRTLCPISSALFARLQDLLASSDAAKDVRLVSVTLDPLHDTPSRLMAYARQYDAGDRWLWITGSEENIAAVARGFGADAANFRAHDSLTLVGDAKMGRWTIFNVLPGSEALLAEVERLASARARAAERR